MEKQRINTKFKFVAGLLKFFAIFQILFAPLYSQHLNSKIIRTLSLSTEEEVLYSDTDILFSVEFPYAKPSEFEYKIKTLPEKVHLKSSFMSPENGGTLLKIWFSFDEEGVYSLPSLTLHFNNRTYNIPFKTVNVKTHPKKILPSVIVEFNDGQTLIFNKNKILKSPKLNVSVGKKIDFLVYVQDTLQILSVDFELPKNAILEQTKKIENFEDASLKKEKTFISSFSWIPLEEGKISLPQISVSVVAFNAQRQVLSFPEFFVTVQKSLAQNQKSDFSSEQFPYAFLELSEENQKEAKKSITEEDCKKIANFRTQEKSSSFFSNAKTERKNFEESLGLFNTQDENKKSFFLILIILTAFLLISSIILIILRKIFISIFFTLLLFLSGFFSVNYGFNLFKKSAIICNSKIRNVPEFSVEPFSSIETGSHVKILQNAGNWFFIQFENSTGWTTKENLIFIE